MGLRTLASAYALVFVAACGLNDRSAAQKVEVICSAFCGCDEPRLPSRQEACISECISEAGGIGDLISEECVQCFVDHRDRCSTIENDCEPVCQFDEPQPDPEPPIDILDAGTPMPSVDAF